MFSITYSYSETPKNSDVVDFVAVKSSRINNWRTAPGVLFGSSLNRESVNAISCYAGM
jgi:hypothetical protein